MPTVEAGLCQAADVPTVWHDAALAAPAREHKALLRCRRIGDATTLLRMPLTYGPGGCSQRMSAALAATSGIANLSAVALLNRLKKAAGWPEALCRDQLARAAASRGPDAAEDALRLIDASRIEGPGKQAWRLHLSDPPQQNRIAAADTPTCAPHPNAWAALRSLVHDRTA